MSQPNLRQANSDILWYKKPSGHSCRLCMYKYLPWQLIGALILCQCERIGKRIARIFQPRWIQVLTEGGEYFEFRLKLQHERNMNLQLNHPFHSPLPVCYWYTGEGRGGIPYLEHKKPVDQNGELPTVTVQSCNRHQGTAENTKISFTFVLSPKGYHFQKLNNYE